MNISAFNQFFSIQNKFFLLIACLMLLITIDVYAANTASETRWAEQLRDNIVIGDPQDLPIKNATGNDTTFFAIYTPHTNLEPKGAVVIMHGKGAHPDWGDIIHPLRVELPDRGWATLSIQMPLPFPDQNNPEQRKHLIESAIPRIDAAMQFLRANSYTHIALVSHSLGSLMALNFLQLKTAATTPEGAPLVNAAVIIGTPSSGANPPLNSPAMIADIKIPLLDIYGSNDNDNVLRSAKARQVAAHKTGNKHYRQVKTTGANHFYHGLNEELVSYIYHWLSKNKP